MKTLFLLLSLTVAFSANAMENELKKTNDEEIKDISLIEETRLKGCLLGSRIQGNIGTCPVERLIEVSYNPPARTLSASECLKNLSSHSPEFRRTVVTKFLVGDTFFDISAYVHEEEHDWHVSADPSVVQQLKEMIANVESTFGQKKVHEELVKEIAERELAKSKK
jgi:hypothetical protein